MSGNSSWNEWIAVIATSRDSRGSIPQGIMIVWVECCYMPLCCTFFRFEIDSDFPLSDTIDIFMIQLLIISGVKCKRIVYKI